MPDEDLERHKLTVFDQLAGMRVCWQTDATYAVLAWLDDDPVQTAETAAPPRWIRVADLKSIRPLNSQVTQLLKAPDLDAAITAAAIAAQRP